jgi:hypothetical protein
MILSPLLGLDKICYLKPTACAVGYCSIAPPGLKSCHRLCRIHVNLMYSRAIVVGARDD